jgi:acetylornithine aminotransferase
VTSTVLTDLLMPTYKARPVAFVSGHGSTLVSTDGDSYLDMVAGIAVCSVGHAHPAVAAAIAAQAATLVHTSNLYGTEPQAVLAERLAAITGGKLSFFANSGAEAIECALKLARKWARLHNGDSRTRIVAADGGFHGRTFGALSATGQPGKQAAFQPIVPGFTHVPYGDIEALRGALSDDVAAVLLEPIQGEAGVIVPPDGYLATVRALCDEAGALLILDEVQTGLGRTGYWLAAEHDGVDADIVCLAKALGGGLPIGACLARPSVARAFEPGDHASTFGGGPVPCAAALATLDVIEHDGLLARSVEGGARLSAGLDGLGRGAVRGRGLMVGLDLGAPIAGAAVAAAFERKVLVNEVAPSVVRFTPPLVVTDDEIDHAIAVMGEVLDAI